MCVWGVPLPLVGGGILFLALLPKIIKTTCGSSLLFSEIRNNALIFTVLQSHHHLLQLVFRHLCCFEWEILITSCCIRRIYMDFSFGTNNLL